MTMITITIKVYLNQICECYFTMAVYVAGGTRTDTTKDGSPR